MDTRPADVRALSVKAAAIGSQAKYWESSHVFERTKQRDTALLSSTTNVYSNGAHRSRTGEDLR